MQGKRQLKDMIFWNWGPTIIWHSLGCIPFYFSKSLHPIVKLPNYEKLYSLKMTHPNVLYMAFEIE